MTKNNTLIVSRMRKRAPCLCLSALSLALGCASSSSGTPAAASPDGVAPAPQAKTKNTSSAGTIDQPSPMRRFVDTVDDLQGRIASLGQAYQSLDNQEDLTTTRGRLRAEGRSIAAKITDLRDRLAKAFPAATNTKASSATSEGTKEDGEARRQRLLRELAEAEKELADIEKKHGSAAP